MLHILCVPFILMCPLPQLQSPRFNGPTLRYDVQTVPFHISRRRRSPLRKSVSKNAWNYFRQSTKAFLSRIASTKLAVRFETSNTERMYCVSAIPFYTARALNNIKLSMTNQCISEKQKDLMV